jgi:hypothetical protein
MLSSLIHSASQRANPSKFSACEAAHKSRYLHHRRAIEKFELFSCRFDDGATTWRRIMHAVAQLANTTPPGALH